MFLQGKAQLAEIFQTEPVFLFEDDDLLNFAREQGVNAATFDADGLISGSDAKLSSDVVFVVSDRTLPRAWAGAGELNTKNVLQIPTHAFDGRTCASAYTLSMCASLDLVDCVARNNAVLAELTSQRQKFSFRSECSTVCFTLADEIRLMPTATSQIIKDAEDYALSTYTEVALIPNKIRANEISPDALGYNVNGSFECHGCLVALHFGIEGENAVRKRRLVELIDRLHQENEFPLTVHIACSQMVAVRTKSGVDVSEFFLGEMNEVLAENLIEVALGTNVGANRETLDWTINSPINESALGFHVAIGDGTRCPHVDFICACPDAYDAFFDATA